MLKVVVRGRKDAGAVKAMIKRFYPDWGMEVLTLQGVRGDEAIVSELASLVNPRYFYVVLLGSSEVRDVDAVEGALPPNVIVHVVSKAKVRNARIDELAREFDVARTAIRLRTRWCREYEAYAFSSKGEELRSFRYDPVHDAFLGLGLWGKLVGEVTGLGELENPLIVRGAGGEHVVYCGPEPCGVFKVFNDRLEVKGRKLTEPLHREVHLENLLKANEEVLRLYEGISAEVLRSFRGWADYVVVPWSGGKDSTAALVLALKVFPRKKVTAVYSDTGIEFPQ
ncbi:MAG: phosphoadenosine phosphosulfate reductase family protein, partial [Desulfurococcales archaeon]|nr:phosphoadenosine phosphosulfate reductase family protein [Desulfurococcales archaeon]